MDYAAYYPPEFPRLSLSLEDLSLTVPGERIMSYSRTRVRALELTRSPAGATVFADSASPYVYQWALTLKLDVPDGELLRAIADLSDEIRKAPPRTGWEIALADVCDPLVERAPERTQSVAWSPPAEYAIAGWTKYFAAFSVGVEAFASTPNGAGYDVETTLTEIS